MRYRYGKSCFQKKKEKRKTWIRRIISRVLYYDSNNFQLGFEFIHELICTFVS